MPPLPKPPKPAPIPPPDPHDAKIRLPEVPMVELEVERVDEDAEVNARTLDMHIIDSNRDGSSVFDDSDVVAMLDEERDGQDTCGWG